MSEHGTRAGYLAHHRAGQEACQPCKGAHAEYQRRYMEGQRRWRGARRLTAEQVDFIRWALRFAKHEREDRDLEALLSRSALYVTDEVSA